MNNVSVTRVVVFETGHYSVIRVMALSGWEIIRYEIVDNNVLYVTEDCRQAAEKCMGMNIAEENRQDRRLYEH